MTHFYLHQIIVCFTKYFLTFEVVLIFFCFAVDASELNKLRTLYGYDLISKQNLFNHLDFLQEFPFILNAIVATCNGGTHATSILTLLIYLCFPMLLLLYYIKSFYTKKTSLLMRGYLSSLRLLMALQWIYLYV